MLRVFWSPYCYFNTLKAEKTETKYTEKLESLSASSTVRSKPFFKL